MKIYLDTSTPTTLLEVGDQSYSWQSDRNLAKDLLKFIHDKLQLNGATWQDISEIHFFSGPGSFTGLRIGATVVNTLSDQLKIPLYDHRGARHRLIVPDYGRPANITQAKK